MEEGKRTAMVQAAQWLTCSAKGQRKGRMAGRSEEDLQAVAGLHQAAERRTSTAATSLVVDSATLAGQSMARKKEVETPTQRSRSRGPSWLRTDSG